MTADLRSLWPRRLWIARHGRTAMNIAGLVQGRLDPPLTPDGLEDAEQVARQLTAKGVRRIVSSTLHRARQTGAVIATRLVVPHALEARLVERDWGPWEGKPRSLRPRMTDPPGAEPRENLDRRVAAALREAITEGRAEDTLLVVHAGVCRTLLGLLGLDASAPFAHDRAIEISRVGGRLQVTEPAPGPR